MSSRSQPPWRNERKELPQRHAPSSTVPAKRSADSRSYDERAKRSTNATNAAEEAWVADEDRFVLAQAKRKAALRVKGGRAKPIDWLAVTLRFVDPTRELLDDEVEDHELEVADPAGILEGLGAGELSELEKDIENYLTLETNRNNREYWNVSVPLIAGSGIANIAGPQIYLQGPPSQVTILGKRSTRRQLGCQRHRQTSCSQDLRTIRNVGSAGQEKA